MNPNIKTQAQTSIINEIEKYAKSNKTYQMKIEKSIGLFDFESINEVVSNLITYDNKEKKINFLGAFYDNPISFLKETGFMSIPENIEIVKECSISLLTSHPKSCFSCRFYKNGNPKNMLIVCMNKKKFQTIFEILAESEMPKRILLATNIYIYHDYAEISKTINDTISVISEEIGIHLNMKVFRGTTIIEIPDIDMWY